MRSLSNLFVLTLKSLIGIGGKVPRIAVQATAVGVEEVMEVKPFDAAGYTAYRSSLIALAEKLGQFSGVASKASVAETVRVSSPRPRWTGQAGY